MVAELFGIPLKASCCCGIPCCPERSCPGEAGDNPLPATLTLELTQNLRGGVATGFDACPEGTVAPDSVDCLSMTITLTLDTYLPTCQQYRLYNGSGSKTCSWCYRITESDPPSEVTVTVSIYAQFSCSPEGGWALVFGMGTGDTTGIDPVGAYGQGARFLSPSCDPMLITGSTENCVVFPRFADCWVCRIEDPNNPGGYIPVFAVHPGFCIDFTISEDP